jgi:hypothetical protein
VLATGGPTLGVSGNIYTTNTLTTTNIFAVGFTSNSTNTNFNFDTLTVPFISGTTLNVSSTSNIGTAYSTSLNTATTITYNEDLFKRGPHLQPSQANSAAIQGWISATCNAASQPSSWWGISAKPVYSNLSTGPKGSTDYGGSVLLPDGRVLFVPSNASNVGIFNPSTGIFSTIQPAGLSAVAGKFRSGVLLPSGNVVFIPWNSSNVGMYDPFNSVYSNIQVGAQPGSGTFQGGVLSPTGNVVMVPRNSANIGIFNPTTLAMTNVGPIWGGGSSLFGSGVLLPNGNLVMSSLTGANIGVYNTYSLSATAFSNVGPIGSSGTYESAILAPNGNVIFAPSNSSNIIVYNPTFVSSPIASGGYSNVAVGALWASGPPNGSFQGGCLLPTGNIVFCPADASNVGMFDPGALTYSNCSFVSTATGKFFGATLIPDGRVIFCPAGSANVGVLVTQTPAPLEFCRLPYLNKL